MDYVARPSVENGQILILALHRRAVRAAVLETRNAATEVPAPRALTQVATDCPHVAQRRRADDLACFGKHWKPLADDRTGREVRYSSRSSDPHVSGVRNANLGAVGDPSKVHQQIRMVDLLGNSDEKIGPTAERDSAGPSERLGGVL